MNVTADRTVEFGLASIGYDDEGVRRAELGSGARRDLRRLSTGPRVRPAAGAGPVQRLLVRRLAAPRADPADGQRVAAARPRRPQHRRPDRPGRGRHLHRRRQVVVDRHAALQLSVHRAAVLPHPGRPPGRPAARRRVSGHHDRLLEFDGSRRRPVDLAAGRSVQLRQGPARPGGRGQPRLPVGAVPRRQRAQHPRRGAA